MHPQHPYVPYSQDSFNNGTNQQQHQNVYCQNGGVNTTMQSPMPYAHDASNNGTNQQYHRYPQNGYWQNGVIHQTMQHPPQPPQSLTYIRYPTQQQMGYNQEQQSPTHRLTQRYDEVYYTKAALLCYLCITDDDIKRQSKAKENLSNFPTYFCEPNEEQTIHHPGISRALFDSLKAYLIHDWHIATKSKVWVLSNDQGDDVTERTLAFFAVFAGEALSRAKTIHEAGLGVPAPVLAFFWSPEVGENSPPREYLPMRWLVYQLLQQVDQFHGFRGPLSHREWTPENLEDIFCHILGNLPFLYIIVHGFDAEPTLRRAMMSFLHRLHLKGIEKGHEWKILLSTPSSKALLEPLSEPKEGKEDQKFFEPSEHCRWWDVGEGLGTYVSGGTGPREAMGTEGTSIVDEEVG
ncbi:hypothetical protein CC80DRAFT_573567 [Byssothecium circinans]|uniref:Uncharacterized protein n=1 Tax=Byssothecium circinans TaxID=147558 RepID=A0A6A5TSG7_9PLEO|nr:hypothetical protein CC80DRAFT_573567 [Byssothecium circinans]